MDVVLRRAPALLALFLLPACDDSDGGGGGGGAVQVADFALVDQNPATPTYNSSVSPRDYMDRVAGFYFTHAG